MVRGDGTLHAAAVEVDDDAGMRQGERNRGGEVVFGVCGEKKAHPLFLFFFLKFKKKLE